MLTVTPKGKARVYDPRRTVAGTLTPALTWGVFGLLASKGNWKSLVLWAVIGGVCGGLYAYYTEHLATKDELGRLGRQLPPDSSAILAYTAGSSAAELSSAAASFEPSPASVATIDADLSATVTNGATGSPALSSAPPGTAPADKGTMLTMLLFRYAGTDTAKRVNAQASSKANERHAAVETELLMRTDPGGRRHVASPSAGALAFGKGALVSWGAFGLVFGAAAGFTNHGGFFGALKGGVVTGIVWAIFGLAAGALYGLWAGRAVSARRLKSVRPLLPPGTSMVLAWAEGAPQEEAVTAWSEPAEQQLILRFDQAPHGAMLRA